MSYSIINATRGRNVTTLFTQNLTRHRIAQRRFVHFALQFPALSLSQSAFAVLSSVTLVNCGLYATHNGNRSRHYSSASRHEAGSRLKYNIAAAFSSKSQYYRSHNHWNFQAKDSSHFQFPAGHDALFVANVRDSSDVALGVADGVGGWTESNIDPAIFARSLCNNMAKAASGTHIESPAMRKNPVSLLEYGYKAVIQDPAVIGGGSTACLAVAGEDGNISVANLGDSGYVHIRLNAIRFKSEAQQHSFNAPYQLSKLPARLRRQMTLFGSTYCEYPQDADVTSHMAQHGDVFVFATDGVWDNLTSGNILEITDKCLTFYEAWERKGDNLTAHENLQGEIGSIKDNPHGSTMQSILANAIVREAKVASLDRRRDSPFAKRSRELTPRDIWRGGKVDDICVVVLIAQRK